MLSVGCRERAGDATTGSRNYSAGRHSHQSHGAGTRLGQSTSSTTSFHSHILLAPVNTLAGQLCVNYRVIAHSLSIVALPKINIPIVDRRCRIVLVLVLIIRGILSVGQ